MHENLTIDGRDFTMVGYTSKVGGVIEETYFANDKSGVQVTVSYRYTEKGHK